MTVKKMANKQLLRIGKVAARLGLCERTVWKLAKAGKIPRVELSKGCIRFDPEDVEAYINRSRSGGDEDAVFFVKLGPVDGPLFAKQRAAVMQEAMMTDQDTVEIDGVPVSVLMDGLTNFLDVIADQLHDRYQVPCLLEDPDGKEEESEVEEEDQETPGGAHGGHPLAPDHVDEPPDA